MISLLLCKYKPKLACNCLLAKLLSYKWSSSAHTGGLKMTAKPTSDVSTNGVNIEPSTPLTLPVKNNPQPDDDRHIYPRLELSNLS